MVLLRFIIHISFSIAIAPLQNCFSLLKVSLDDRLKYSFLVVTIFTSALSLDFLWIY